MNHTEFEARIRQAIVAMNGGDKEVEERMREFCKESVASAPPEILTIFAEMILKMSERSEKTQKEAQLRN